MVIVVSNSEKRSKQNFCDNLSLYLDVLPASLFFVVFPLSVLRLGQGSILPSLLDFFIYFHFSKNCCCFCLTRKIYGKTRRKRSSLVRNEMHFSPKAPEGSFTFGYILSREVDWSIKNHTLKMVIDPWPGVRSGGQCSPFRGFPSKFFFETKALIFFWPK